MNFINTDVAVPGLNRDFAYSRPLIVPVERIFRAFVEAVRPLHEQRDKLEEINERLSIARDLLLPKLINSEIVV
jgi:type I restriction enzyme S subunit